MTSKALILILFLQTELKGTKLACGEGGCGACAVSVSTFENGQEKVPSRLHLLLLKESLYLFLKLKTCDISQILSVNSCLRPVVTMGGASVTTVEGLSQKQVRQTSRL